VELKPQGGNDLAIQRALAATADLLALAGSNSRTLLDAHTVPAGRYEWVMRAVPLCPRIGAL
jgi:hypothetical protein